MFIRENVVNESAGKALKEERESRGLTQRELAKLLDVSYNAIYQYEKGNNRIHYFILVRLAELWGEEWIAKLFGIAWRDMMKPFETIKELYTSLPEVTAETTMGQFDYGWSQSHNGTPSEKVKRVNEVLAVHGYCLKNEEDDDGYYNDIRTHFSNEIVLLSEVDWSKKEDVLLQGDTYAGLCKNGEFRLKKKMSDGKYYEVIKIEAKEKGYSLSLFHPLSPYTKECNFVEEALYHIPLEHNPLTHEQRLMILEYFGEE